MLIFFLSFLTLIFQPSQCKTILVDGVSEWDSPTVHVGDSIIFNHKHHYKLYIFQNRGAFSVCNFTQATLLTKPNSTSFKWNPSRLGFFYFSFSDNGSLSPCQQGQKLAIEVLLPPSPRENVAPSPASIPPGGSLAPETSGGVMSPSPAAYLWPFRPHGKPLRGARPPVVAATVPSAVPYNGVPFINSNPAVPLPTGEVDSATIRPLPTSGNGEPPQVAGLLAVQIPLCYLFFLML